MHQTGNDKGHSFLRPTFELMAGYCFFIESLSWNLQMCPLVLGASLLLYNKIDDDVF